MLNLPSGVVRLYTPQDFTPEIAPTPKITLQDLAIQAGLRGRGELLRLANVDPKTYEGWLARRSDPLRKFRHIASVLGKPVWVIVQTIDEEIRRKKEGAASA